MSYSFMGKIVSDQLRDGRSGRAASPAASSLDRGGGGSSSVAASLAESSDGGMEGGFLRRFQFRQDAWSLGKGTKKGSSRRRLVSAASFFVFVQRYRIQKQEDVQKRNFS